MKKNYKSFLVLVLSVLLAHSVSYSQKFEGGIIAGLLGSQVAGDPSSGYNKLGGYFGLMVKRQFTLKSAAQLEIYYIQKGARENPREENGYFQYLLKINNIEIPLLYIYTINKQLQIPVGIAYTYLLGTPHEEANFSSFVPNTPFNKHSATFILGINYIISDHLSASFRTNNSILPIRPHASGATRLFNHGQYSDALTIGLVYHFINPKNN